MLRSALRTKDSHNSPFPINRKATDPPTIQTLFRNGAASAASSCSRGPPATTLRNRTSNAVEVLWPTLAGSDALRSSRWPLENPISRQLGQEFFAATQPRGALRIGGDRCAKKRSAESKAAPGTPTKGRIEQHLAGAPSGALVQALLRCFKSPKAQVGRFPRSSNLTHARHSVVSRGGLAAATVLVLDPPVPRFSS